MAKQETYSASGETNPAAHAVAVAPQNVDLEVPSRAIYIGGAGNLTVMMAAKRQVVTFYNVAAGMYYPIRAIQVMAGTSATDIVVMY